MREHLSQRGSFGWRRFAWIGGLGLICTIFAGVQRWQALRLQEARADQVFFGNEQIAILLAEQLKQSSDLSRSPDLSYDLATRSLSPRPVRVHFGKEIEPVLNDLAESPLIQFVSLAGQSYRAQRQGTTIALWKHDWESFLDTHLKALDGQFLLVSRQLAYIYGTRPSLRPFDWEQSELRAFLANYPNKQGLFFPDFISRNPVSLYRSIPGTNLILFRFADQSPGRFLEGAQTLGLSGEKSLFTVRSVKGKVLTKTAGGEPWQVLAVGRKLSNSDTVWVQSGGELQMERPQSSPINVNRPLIFRPETTVLGHLRGMAAQSPATVSWPGLLVTEAQQVLYTLRGLALFLAPVSSDLVLSSPHSGQVVETLGPRASLRVRWKPTEGPYRVYVWASGKLRGKPFAQTDHPSYHVVLPRPGLFWVQVEDKQGSSLSHLVTWKQKPLDQWVTEGPGGNKPEWDRRLVHIRFPTTQSEFLGTQSIPLLFDIHPALLVEDIQVRLQQGTKQTFIPLKKQARELLLPLDPGEYLCSLQMTLRHGSRRLSGYSHRIALRLSSQLAEGPSLFPQTLAEGPRTLWYLSWSQEGLSSRPLRQEGVLP